METPGKPAHRGIFAFVSVAILVAAALLVLRSPSENTSPPPAPPPHAAAVDGHVSSAAAPDRHAEPQTLAPQPPASAPQAPAASTAVVPRASNHAASVTQNAAATDADIAALSPKQHAILEKIPSARFREDVLKLDDAARFRVLKTLAANPPPDADYASLRVTPKGALYYVCDLMPSAAAMPERPGPAKMSAPGGTPPAAAPVSDSQPPASHSRPGSRNILFLDFTGGDIAGTAWNTMADEGQSPVSRYRAKPYNTEGDDTDATFTDREQREILEIWERVAEDFAPFDVDVTTEKPAAFTRTTARALITYSRDKNGAYMPAITGTSGVGGVALRDSFGDENFATEYSPAFIYHDRLLNDPDSIAYAVSHELGHNLGLSHDGPGATHDLNGEGDYGYYQGHGSDATSWAPIMGAGYGRSVVQWSKGEYRNANNHEDDLAIIGGKLGPRAGLAAPARDDAPALAPLENGRLGATGVLRHAGDAHYYLINLGSSGYIDFALTPARVSGTGSIIGNTDLKLDIINTNGIETASNNPAAATTASLHQWLSSGTSYVRVSSTGAGTPLSTTPTGYTAYGSIGQYTLSTNLIHARPSLASALNSNLTWTTEPGSVASWTGQTATTHDGVAAAQSGAVAYQADSSGIVTTVEGPGTVSFWWKCSGQGTDELVFAMTNADGITSTGAYISDGVDWQQRTFTINTTGTHQFGWTFVRASPPGTPPGVTGHGWVDQVVWTPAAPLVFNTTPAIREIAPEAGQFDITIEATQTWTATPGADALWLSATPASGAGSATLAVAHAANDTGRARRGTITITSAGINRVCEITQPPAPPSLATALDTSLSWQTGGDGNWAGQLMTSHDGLHAARSGIIFGNQQTWLQATVDGPGTLEFWWKISSEEEDSEPGGEPWGDILRFHVDGSEHARTSGEKDWTRRAFTLTGTGAHTLRWAYEKDPFASFGSDAAWLDQVVWTTGTAAAPMLSVSPDSRRVPDASGQFTVAVSANVAWSAVSSVPWLAISPSTGSNAATLNITYAANISTVERAGVIKITGGGLTDTCTVTQAARITGTTGNNNNNNSGSGGGGGAASLWLPAALALLFGLRSRRKSE